MITVHHLENSRSQRVLWLLEELGLPYEIRRYRRNPKTMLAPPELRAVHPLGKSPVIVDGDPDDAPRIVAETGAIIEYLVEKADGQLGPPAHRDSALRYRHFMHYAEGSLMPPLLVKLVLMRVPIFGKAAQKRIQPMIDVHLDFVESELASRPWFAGDAMSAADVMMSFPLEAARARGGLDATRPATIAWIDKIHARPAYQTALAKGGPYAYA
ncbi:MULTISPECIES: glutathione S-transferase family protein [unclassified Sphingomonas]|uniref:glutathione S-transferase family protein n=1 Tax=unclassified Sphingomonas TaxID=196159 RepID=UPI002151A9E8|nr:MULTISPECIES: glutathione S-transferase [unclassified Sphingomonas]MCR5872324.1 glutathione S-transferase [Sphingomonas sp. J344]UUX99381.1 glutathione S-transferase [Sphingomonas sp. J315]